MLACQLDSVNIYRSGYPSLAAVEAANLRVAKLPSANDRRLLFEMPTVVEWLQTFANNVDCPTGATGIKAYLAALTALLPEGRRQITPDSAISAHVREFTRILRLALDVNPDEFGKANITKASGVTQSGAGKHAALLLKLQQAIRNCMQITENMDEQKQFQISLLRSAVRNFGEFFYHTAEGINQFINPILPRNTLQAGNHLLLKLLTTSTADEGAAEITYGFARRFNCAEQAGGLEQVLNMLRFAVTDTKVLDHLYDTIRDVLISLDPDELLNNDELHEDLPAHVDNEVVMTFLLRQVCCDCLGGIKKIFDLRDSIPITGAAFDSHPKYGQGSAEDIYKFRSTRLPKMLATVLSEIQLHGTTKSWSINDIQQQSIRFLRSFNMIIAPGESTATTVSEDATPDSIMLASAHNWIPRFDSSENAENAGLPYALTNSVFQQFTTLMTVFDYLTRPDPAPKLPRDIPSGVFAYPFSMSNIAMLQYFDEEVDSIAAIAAAHFGIPVPLRSDTEDYKDFWAQIDLGLRRKTIAFPPDTQWMRQSPAWPGQSDTAEKSRSVPDTVFRLATLFRMAVVGATVHITTQQDMLLANPQDVRGARIALMKYHMPPTDSFDPQHASGQAQRPASPRPEVTQLSSDEDDTSAADPARKPAPASKTAGKRKEAAAKETDEQAGLDKDADPTKAAAHPPPKKTCRQARASDFLAVFDQNTIAGVNATNNLTKRYKLTYIATVVNSILFVPDVKAALEGVIDPIRLDIAVGLWLDSVLQRRKTTNDELHIQLGQAMRSQSSDLNTTERVHHAFECMVTDLVTFCKDADQSPLVQPETAPSADSADSDELDGDDSKPAPAVSNSAHTMGQ